MRHVTIGLFLATALAGYAAGQWQLAESRSLAQDALAPPPSAAAKAVEQSAESDLERKYVEKSRQYFRTLTPEQQEQMLGMLDQQLRQAEALVELKRVRQELKTIAEKYPGTVGANVAMEAERVLQQRLTGSPPQFLPNGVITPSYPPTYGPTQSPYLDPVGQPVPDYAPVPRRPKPSLQIDKPSERTS